MKEREESVRGGGQFHMQYEPREILGKGLSSTVRKCVSKETGQEYAVKIVDKSQEESIIESISVEMQVLRTLPDHKHIINLLDVFESEAFVFMVFELATSGELFDYLTKMVKLSEKRTRQVMFQIFQAVEHMHAYNVIHRDLKVS
jgi:phosphorylase kinase gamma subunit